MKARQPFTQSKSLILSIFFLILLIGTITYIVNEKNRQDAVAALSFRQQASIEVDGDTVVPSTLTIKPSTQVRFKALDDTAHRMIATAGTSSPDSRYGDAELDFSHKGVASFVFIKPGVYKMHDVFHPKANVVIEVKE